MNFFPTKTQKFILVDDQQTTIERLNRRTEIMESLVTSGTDKSLSGIITGNRFKVISSAIGTGAFCVMTGTVEKERVTVQVEINKVFKILLSIILCLPIVGFTVLAMVNLEEFSAIFILVAVAQILMIRFVFIELAFRILSRYSLYKLRDVLDLNFVSG